MKILDLFHSFKKVFTSWKTRNDPISFGSPGYNERVNFQELIGYYVVEETGEKLPTSEGIIHYSKKGAHIITAFPKNGTIADNRVRLRLSIQRALFGSITPSLRMVTADIDEEWVRVIFYYDGRISEKVREMAEVAGSEIIASFNKQMLNLKIERLDAPNKMPTLAEVVYRRYESNL